MVAHKFHLSSLGRQKKVNLCSRPVQFQDRVQRNTEKPCLRNPEATSGQVSDVWAMPGVTFLLEWGIRELSEPLVQVTLQSMGSLVIGFTSLVCSFYCMAPFSGAAQASTQVQDTVHKTQWRLCASLAAPLHYVPVIWASCFFLFSRSSRLLK